MRKNVSIIVFDEFPDDSRIRRYKNILNYNSYFVYIVCLKSKGKKIIEKIPGYTVYRVPLSKKRGSLIRRIYEYFIFLFLCFWIINYLFIFKKVNIFHLNTLPDFIVISAIIPRIFGASVILDYHELFPEAMIQFSEGKIKLNSFFYKVIKLVENISYRFANNVIVFHDPAKEILMKRIKSNKNPVVIMNCVDPNEIPTFCRKKTDVFYIVYNGVINENLNLSQVIDSLKLIKKSNYEIYSKIFFSIYGYGPDLKNVLLKAKKDNIENIVYKGWMKYDEMIKELETASVCILPPKKDIYSDLFYSLKLTEMIYLRIPVIASRLNTYLKYYPENCLFYFDCGNSEHLAEKILYIYKNSDNIYEYTNRAFNEYKKYSWEIMSKRYIQLIDNIIFSEK